MNDWCHNFILLDVQECRGNRGNFSHDKRAISVPDDWIMYMYDSLLWVPSIHPSNSQDWPGHGLNLCGSTLFTDVESPVLENALQHWIGLFAHAPEHFQLSSIHHLLYKDSDTDQEKVLDVRNFYPDENCSLFVNSNTIKIRKIEIKKGKLVDILKHLAELTHTVSISHGSYVLLHQVCRQNQVTHFVPHKENNFIKKIPTEHGPYHDFILLKTDEYDEKGYGNFFHDERSILIPDEWVMYMYDSLMWIPSSNPSNPKHWPGHGLNLYGPTLLTHREASVFAKVLRHWICLFSHAPTHFQLRISPEFGRDQDDEEQEEQFDRSLHDEALTNYLESSWIDLCSMQRCVIEVEKENWIKMLTHLANSADVVADSHGQYVLLHNGL